MPAPHKVVLKDILEEFQLLVGRLEAAVARAEGMSPPTVLPPSDPAAVEAADRMIRSRVLELGGAGVQDAE